MEDDVKKLCGIDINVKGGKYWEVKHFIRSKKLLITGAAPNVYIGSMDSYVKDTGNFITAVNPVTRQILMTRIPRDYYVKLTDKNGSDKLTHLGLGVMLQHRP